MKRSSVLIFAAALFANGHHSLAHEGGDFDSMLAQKRKADITFAQLMQVMHQATSMIFDGILYENPETVALGAHLLAEHPAPANGPAAAILKERRDDFKNVMPTYDKVFHGAAESVTLNARKRNWQEAYAGYREITDACVACHATWRPHAISRQVEGMRR